MKDVVMNDEQTIQDELNMLGYFSDDDIQYNCNLEKFNSKLIVFDDHYLLTVYSINNIIVYYITEYNKLIDCILDLQDVMSENAYLKKISISSNTNLKTYIYIQAKRDKKTSRQITENMVRVKSSNIWAYVFDIEMGENTGTLYVQFKSRTGGPGDIYRYYEVPLSIWKKFVSTGSKGHFFWKNIRNKYLYSKLTSDKKGKLPNAVN